LNVSILNCFTGKANATAMNFKDHFSGHARDYARARPTYPRALFEYLASLCEEHELAWDCGTGNGQAALDLTAYFTRIIATDASAEQLQQATEHTQIEYRHTPAEKTSFDAHSFDLITVAQALHWFDIPAFFREAARVLKPRGVLAVWSYELCKINPAVDAVTAHYYSDIVGADWPPERKLVAAGYRTIEFPFDEISPPPFSMQVSWSLGHYLSYLNSWSATRRYQQRTEQNPLDLIRTDLTQAWGTDGKAQTITWPLNMRVGWTARSKLLPGP
jgi:SAM-dependent methyltransferase